MSITWSYAATGLTIAITALAVGQRLVPRHNRPSMFRGVAGELALGALGLMLSGLLIFFGFRLFWDNGFWGLLQLLVVAFVAGWLSSLRVLHNGLTPLVCLGLATAQAIKIW